jgi:hypothetical protein
MYHELKLKCSSKTMQSSNFAAHSGLYLPSIKCHWEIEGAEGPLKTEPNRHNISLLEHVYEIIQALHINSRSLTHWNPARANQQPCKPYLLDRICIEVNCVLQKNWSSNITMYTSKPRELKVVTNNTRPFKQKHPLIDKLKNLRSRPACVSKYTQLTYNLKIITLII